MDRAQLLAALKVCKPALASNDLIPVLSHYCFGDDIVFAYNDVLCISKHIDVGFSCALPGEALYKILDSFTSDEVGMVAGKQSMVITARSKKSEIILPSISPKAFLYKAPRDKAIKEKFEIASSWVDCLAYCLNSVPDQPLLPYQMGVTVAGNGDMYSSDGMTLSYARSSLKPMKAVLLPVQFCKQVVSLGSPADEEGELLLGKGFVIAEFPIQGVTVFSKLPFESEVGRFENVLKEHLDAGVEPEGFAVPSQLLPCLDRCLAVLSGELEKVVALSVDDQGFDATVISRLGKVDEQFMVDTGVAKGDHYVFDVEILRKAIEAADTMEFFDKCLAVVTTDLGIQLVAQKSTAPGD